MHKDRRSSVIVNRESGDGWEGLQNRLQVDFAHKTRILGY